MSGVYDVEYDACMHGGKRLKHQRLRTNIPELAAMAIVCDGRHSHESFGLDPITGKFATEEEAAYAWEFCRTVAGLTAMGLRRKGLVFEPRVLRKDQLKTATGRQPRGKANPRLMSEFKTSRVWLQEKELLSRPEYVLAAGQFQKEPSF